MAGAATFEISSIRGRHRAGDGFRVRERELLRHQLADDDGEDR